MSLFTTIRSGRVLRYGAVLFLGLGLGMTAEWAFHSRTLPAEGADPAAPKTASAGGTVTNPPWGALETLAFPLELSDEFLPQVSPWLRDPQWWFEGYTLERVTNLFRAAGLAEAQVTQLMDGVEWEVTAGGTSHRDSKVAMENLTTVGVRVAPPPRLVLELAPASRQRIYAVLARSEQNPSQRFPFRFAPPELERRIAGLEAGPEKRALVKQLAYVEQDTICLADLEVLRHVLSTNELRSLLKALYQTTTLMLRVEISSQTDVNALVRYWGRGNRARFIKPFLQGLAKAPGEKSVGVSFFMPTFARTHLYTFPDPASQPRAGQQDCLWTALNFFNEQPDNRLLKGEYAQEVLRTQYERTDRPATYGDLVGLAGPSGDLQHVSVYIAEDVVFTKNGAGNVQPWVLMRIPDMVMKFRSLGPMQPVIYHRKAV